MLLTLLEPLPILVSKFHETGSRFWQIFVVRNVPIYVRAKIFYGFGPGMAPSGRDILSNSVIVIAADQILKVHR
jgi:hypothetical protein